jgi:prepilin-type N-terminal cleavage/methylation domain-containing protein
MRTRDGFTLIELLIVIAIIAVLSIVVILSLNPAELLRQARDSNRVSDMTSVTNAVNLYLTDTGGIATLGTANTVYVSIPDPTATSTAGDQCQGLGLIALPATYAYHCAASSTFRAVDGTGWIPLNFSNMSTGAPLGQLPADPINTSSSRLYYTYMTDQTHFEVTAPMESLKYKLGGSNDVITPDGGALASVYEKGSKLGLEPLDYGDSSLVGYWTFDEGSGSTAYDYSGNNATGSWHGTAVHTTGMVGPYAGSFDGSNNYVNLPAVLDGPSQLTVVAWINSASPGGWVFAHGSCGAGGYRLNVGLCGASDVFQVDVSGGEVNQHDTVPSSTWVSYAGTYDGSVVRLYRNGSLMVSNGTTGAIRSVGGGSTIGQYFSGLIDDVRIYNRALSAAEVQALYNAEK